MTLPLRVLLVEDSATDAKLALHELRKLGRPIESLRVEDDAGMRDALAGTSWDVILCDWSMPKFSGRAALGVLKELELDLPFVIVSGTVGEESAVEAMRAGAADYVLKDRLGRLVPVVERELRENEERAARRLAEMALRESEARFSRLARSGIVGIVFADLDGNVFDANDSYLAMIGFSREDVASGRLRWNALVPEEARAIVGGSVGELRATGVAVPRELELLRKDGARIPVLQGAALLDERRIIAFVVDMTRQRRAEAAQAKSAEQVKREQAERERAEEALRRSEEQLRQAQKMEAVGRLAGGVAHDFNNILSVILSCSELMLESVRAEDPLREGVDEIRAAALRASGLTRQLLLFSSQQVSAPKVVDLNDVLANMEKMLKRIVGEDVTLVLATGERLGRVRVDPVHIEQVVLNLAVNARDAMPRGGTLTLETANVQLDGVTVPQQLPSEPGRYVMLAVSDTGIGMDKATQARIFEPFFTTKPRGKGTGLGLSTVFGIVQQSGGTIWVYSEPGKGATFKVYLPFVDAEPEAAQPPPVPTTLQGTETILVVEDEDHVRGVVVSVLRRYGYVVLAAANAAEALRLADGYQDGIDLLLTDVVLPQLSGPELGKRLVLKRPAMKVLCVSGYTDDSIVRHGVLETGVAYLQKPFTPQSLATKIRHVLDAPPS